MNNIDWKTISNAGSPAESRGFRIWSSFLAWQRAINDVLRPHDLTQTQFSLLASIGWLTRTGAAITQQDIAAFSGMKKMNISRVLANLETIGLVSRTSMPQDARAKHIALTHSGSVKLQETLPLVETADDIFFDGQN